MLDKSLPTEKRCRYTCARVVITEKRSTEVGINIHLMKSVLTISVYEHSLESVSILRCSCQYSDQCDAGSNTTQIDYIKPKTIRGSYSDGSLQYIHSH